MNPTSTLVPPAQQRPTAVLHLNYSTLGSWPPVPQPKHPLIRPLTVFVMADLASHRGALHWRSAKRAWDAHIARRHSLAPYDDDLFWGRLTPALERALVLCVWDHDWPVAA